MNRTAHKKQFASDLLFLSIKNQSIIQEANVIALNFYSSKILFGID